MSEVGAHHMVGFQVTSLVLSILLAVVLCANIYYYNKILRDGGTKEVSASAATAMLWVNGIFLFLVLLFLAFAIYRVAMTAERKAALRRVLSQRGPLSRNYAE